MLDQMRRHSRSTFIYVLFGILIAVFILTFNTASRVDSAAAVDVAAMAQVGDTTLTGVDVNLAMILSADPPPPALSAFEKLQAKQMYEGTRLVRSGVAGELARLTPFAGAVPASKLEKVMVELSESVLVAQEAKKLGLAVSDTELAKRVVALQRANGVSLTDENGNFDPKKYDQFVRFSLGTSKAQLEDFLRREILRDKLAQIVTSGIVASPAEIDALYRADRQRPRLEMVVVDAQSAAKAVTVTDAEAEAFAAANAEKIAAEYKAQESKYKVAEKVNLRGILIAAPAADDDADAAKKKEADDQRAAKRGAAEAVKAELDKAWAGEVALDPVPPPSDDPDKPAAAVGEPKKASELEGAEKLARLLHHFSKVAKEKSEDSIYKDEGGKYVEDYDAAKLERQPFGPAVKAAVVGAQEGQLIGPVEGKKGWWVLVIEKKIAGSETPLEAAKLELAKGLMAKDKIEKELEGIAQGVLLAAQGTPTTALAEVVKLWAKSKGLPEDALSATEAPPMGKSPFDKLQDLSELFPQLAKGDSADDVPLVGKHPEMAKAVYALTQAKPLAGKVFTSEDGKTRYVVRLAADKASDEAATAKGKAEVGRALTALRRQEAYRAFAQKLIAQAKADGKVKETEAFSLKLKEEQARIADELKRAGGGEPAAAAPAGGGGIGLRINGKEVNVEQPGGAAPAPAAAAPAAPAENAPAK